MVRGVAKVMQISTEEFFLGVKYCSPGRVQNVSRRPSLPVPISSFFIRCFLEASVSSHI